MLSVAEDCRSAPRCGLVDFCGFEENLTFVESWVAMTTQGRKLKGAKRLVTGAHQGAESRLPWLPERENKDSDEVSGERNVGAGERAKRGEPLVKGRGMNSESEHLHDRTVPGVQDEIIDDFQKGALRSTREHTGRGPLLAKGQGANPECKLLDMMRDTSPEVNADVAKVTKTRQDGHRITGEISTEAPTGIAETDAQLAQLPREKELLWCGGPPEEVDC